MTRKKDYDEAVTWAEQDAALPRNSTTARRGADAAESGRILLSRANAGHSDLDSASPHRTESPQRQVRLPRDISEQVDAIAARQGRRASEIMREAITLYVQEHHIPGLDDRSSDRRD